MRIAERSVTVLLHRYEELVALRLGDVARLRERLAEQGGVILALDGAAAGRRARGAVGAARRAARARCCWRAACCARRKAIWRRCWRRSVTARWTAP